MQLASKEDKSLSKGQTFKEDHHILGPQPAKVILEPSVLDILDTRNVNSANVAIYNKGLQKENSGGNPCMDQYGKP
jgi:hypothetical protein